MTSIFTIHYPTPEAFDDLLVSTDGEALTGLWFKGSRDERRRNIMELSNVKALPPVVKDTFRWLDIYFTGCQPDFIPAYRLEQATPFRKAVVDTMCEIPFGQTVTYGEIAKRLGIRSAQAVGGAVGWNPIGIIIPCHRVMGADGSLTGYGGGLHNKVALLRLEGIALDKKLF